MARNVETARAAISGTSEPGSRPQVPGKAKGHGKIAGLAAMAPPEATRTKRFKESGERGRN
jgi:hypothetical protein